MKRIIILFALIPSFAFAQSATSTGVGIARSNSQSTAVAISGQGGNGGNGGGGTATSSLVVNNSVPATETINNTGTSTVRNVPTVFAPGLSAAGLETCLGSVSGGVGVIGTGVSFGTSIPDPGCAARLDARTLWAFGLRKAAVARLCLQADVYRSMPDVCVLYVPQVDPATGYYVAAATPQAGPVEVVMQKTGKHALCDDYDASRHRCRVWAR